MNRFLRSASVIIRFAAFSLAVAITAVYISVGFTRAASSAMAYSEEMTIIIDPGHGGMDGGAVADDGTLEKGLNLSLSSDIERLLFILGARTKMTRDTDVMLSSAESKHKKREDLENRAAMANNGGNCIFISIHMNKFPVPKYSGLQVYYSGINQDSAALAAFIQANVKSHLQPSNERQTKLSGSSIYLLSNIRCPAVLIECGFLSNRDELELLKTDDYRKKLALIIAASALEFISSEN